MRYSKYNWVGNRISDDDMCLLYKRKQQTKKPITQQVAEAVKEYIAKKLESKEIRT